MRLLTIAVAICAFALPAVAQAKGTVRVQQSDGSVQIYRNATIRVAGRTLQIMTADKKGSLIIAEAACSHVGALLRCLPYRYVLQQNGAHLLDFERGTVYFNPTSARQQLSHSSTQIEPNGVLMAVVSKKGTYVTLTGTLDGRSS